jgi:hypothetical protein
MSRIPRNISIMTHGSRLHGGRARLVGTTSHFTEEFTGTELRQRLMDRQIHVRIYSDKLARATLRPRVHLVICEKTPHPRHAPAKDADRWSRSQMRERVMNENINAAGNDIKSSRIEIAFFADDAQGFTGKFFNGLQHAD